MFWYILIVCTGTGSGGLCLPPKVFYNEAACQKVAAGYVRTGHNQHSVDVNCVRIPAESMHS